jgi:beta-lactam-binding protein with PASTA domain/tRNA A-37 threonylcarbamoyl transferase component Bud32
VVGTVPQSAVAGTVPSWPETPPWVGGAISAGQGQGPGPRKENLASTRIAEHIGRVLGGRYRLLAPIGTGASAHVFLADDVKLRRRVAVKILHPALADDEGFLRRFRAEAHAAAALNHPNIMSVYDWGEEADGPFLVCEFLGGGSLRAILDRGTRLSPSQALVVGLEAARALEYASRRGLVHRDIKPANLLFDDDGRLRIADFGLARALAEAAWTEPSGTVLGTARYASPEQVKGVPLDGKADVYSLALVLHEAVTGRVPFAADTTVGTLMGRLERPIPAAPDLGPLGPIVARAGRPEAEERLDAMAFGAALQAAANDLPAPTPLPLAGVAALDEVVGHVDRDPTELGAATTEGDAAPTLVGPLPLPAGDPTLVAVPAPGVDGTVVLAPPAAPTAPVSPPPTVPPAARRRRRWPVVLLVVAVLLAGSGVGAWALLRNQAPSHPVPNEVNKPEAEAVAALRALKFKVAFRRQYVNGTVAGQVTGQSPEGRPGTTLEEGRTVTLTVSEGPVPVSVPDLSSLDRQAAEDAIRTAGFTVGKVTERSDENAPEGRVLDFSPKGGLAPTGSAIDLTVSSGPAPRVVPDVTGAKDFDAAAALLSAQGLKAARGEDYSDTVPEGAIVSSNPGAGSSVARGSTVTVVVSKGQPVVPSVNGLSLADATAKLNAAGYKLGSVYGPSGGRVFLTMPGSGTRLKRGSSVSLFIL